jgi:DUF917 family protein
MIEGTRLGSAELEAVVLGGAVLGGGGGGRIAEGLRLGRHDLALGTPTLVSLEALAGDALIATASLVGAPASAQASVEPADYLRAWELLADLSDRPLGGVISCENGGTASIHGWLQSAAFGFPVVDAPADGRAHPTGDMGAMGLESVRGFVGLQAAAGGSRGRCAYLEQQVRGPLAETNRLVRAAADVAGGLVAVARNPVSVAYLYEHAAAGALSQALALGRRVGAAVPDGARAVIGVLADELAATLVVEGQIDVVELKTRGGYDVGLARVGRAELSIWNEYLTLERDGERLATFPDLTITIDLDSAWPITSAELAVGRRVAVLAAPAARLILGAGLRVPANFLPLEQAVGREILRYTSCCEPDVDTLEAQGHQGRVATAGDRGGREVT